MDVKSQKTHEDVDANVTMRDRKKGQKNKATTGMTTRTDGNALIAYIKNMAIPCSKLDAMFIMNVKTIV